jgi:DNA-binding transcriptional LysR family regulator
MCTCVFVCVCVCVCVCVARLLAQGQVDEVFADQVVRAPLILIPHNQPDRSALARAAQRGGLPVSV